MTMLLLLLAITTGSWNILFGMDPAPNLTTGSYNLVVGDGAGQDLTTEWCQIRIGHLGPESKSWFANRYGVKNFAKVHFSAGDEIEKHCGYSKGRVDAIIRQALLK